MCIRDSSNEELEEMKANDAVVIVSCDDEKSDLDGIVQSVQQYDNLHKIMSCYYYRLCKGSLQVA